MRRRSIPHIKLVASIRQGDDIERLVRSGLKSVHLTVCWTRDDIPILGLRNATTHHHQHTFRETILASPNVVKLADMINRFSHLVHFWIELPTDQFAWHRRAPILYRLLASLKPRSNYFVVINDPQMRLKIPLIDPQSILIAYGKESLDACITQNLSGVVYPAVKVLKPNLEQHRQWHHTIAIKNIDSTKQLAAVAHLGLQWVFTDQPLLQQSWLTEMSTQSKQHWVGRLAWRT